MLSAIEFYSSKNKKQNKTEKPLLILKTWEIGKWSYLFIYLFIYDYFRAVYNKIKRKV